MSSDVSTLFKVPIEISGWLKQRENLVWALTDLHVLLKPLLRLQRCLIIWCYDTGPRYACQWAFQEARLVGRSVIFLRTAVRARKSQPNFYLYRLLFRNIFLSSSWSNSSPKLCFVETFRLSQWQWKSCCLQVADPKFPDFYDATELATMFETTLLHPFSILRHVWCLVPLKIKWLSCQLNFFPILLLIITTWW